MPKPESVDEYITQIPESAQVYALQIRQLIKQAVPDAEEKISYSIPYYGYHGRLVYWAAYKSHIGLYIMDAARQALAEEIKPYWQSKSTLHFKLDQPLPTDLITSIVTVQAKANAAKK